MRLAVFRFVEYSQAAGAPEPQPRTREQPPARHDAGGREAADGPLEGEQVTILLYRVVDDVLPDFSNFDDSSVGQEDDLELVGFQTFGYLRRFLSTVLRLFGTYRTTLGSPRIHQWVFGIELTPSFFLPPYSLPRWGGAPP